MEICIDTCAQTAYDAYTYAHVPDGYAACWLELTPAEAWDHPTDLGHPRGPGSPGKMG